MKHLVVARYKEDISWIKNIDSKITYTTYNKFYTDEPPVLPNVGREGNTYLYHIVNNYDNLADCNIFLQGDPSFHCRSIFSQINNINEIDNYPIFFGAPHNETIFSMKCPSHTNGLPMYYFFDLLFGMKLAPSSKIIFYPGAQFAVDKETLLCRPKRFYQFLLKFLSYEIDPIEGYIVERLWPYIFDKTLPLSSKYELFV